MVKPGARKPLPNNGDFDGPRTLLESLSARDLASTASLTHAFFLFADYFRAIGSHLNRNHAHRKMPRQKKGTLINHEVCVCVRVCARAQKPPVTPAYRHAPQMASASRLFTAAPARIMAKGCPSFSLLFLF